MNAMRCFTKQQRSSQSQFKKLKQLGCEGTFARVFKVRDLTTKRLYALKVFKEPSDEDDLKCISESVQREIEALHVLCHVNIIKCYGTLEEPGKHNLHLIFEYVSGGDLCHAFCREMMTEWQPERIKKCMRQLLQAVAHCHAHHIVHRDIKPGNLLFNANGDLKLADFGLARQFDVAKNDDDKPLEYTNKVVTLFYRAPELLLGACDYTSAIDLWSVGCVFSELLTGGLILIQSDPITEIEQIHRIWEVCGTPDTNSWPQVMHLPYYGMMKSDEALPSRLHAHLPTKCSLAALTLAESLLCLTPYLRCSANAALAHSFFTDDQRIANDDDVPS